MPSNRKLVLTLEAEHDLADIWQYTAETWGERQAENYAAKMHEGLLKILEFPFIGPLRNDIAYDLRSRLIEHHIAYYRVTDDAVIVRRIAHVRRDPGELALLEREVD
jgi:toxin ParE1/3/4